jgi:glutathione S-transferase
MRPDSDCTQHNFDRMKFGLIFHRYVNGWLAKTKFLCGDEPTIADFRFGTILYFARVAVQLPKRLVEYAKTFNMQDDPKLRLRTQTENSD